jgi:hypothetical protein
MNRGPVEMNFADRVRGQQIVLVTNGYPHGMTLREPVESVVSRIKRGSGIEEAVERLHDGNTATAKRIAEAFGKTAFPRMPIWFYGLVLVAAVATFFDLPARLVWIIVAVLAARWVGRFFGDRKMRAGMRAVATALSGDPLKSRAEVNELLTTKNAEAMLRSGRFGSLALLARALAKEKDDTPRAELVASMTELGHMYPDTRIVADQVERVTGVRPKKAAHHIGKPFPIDYALVNRDPLTDGLSGTGATLTLRDSVAKLAPGQLMLVILVGDYRTNAYYSKFMFELAATYPVFADRLPTIHILTSYPNKLPRKKLKNPFHYGELYSVAEKLPLTIFSDPDDSVAQIVQATGSPTNFLIDYKGNVMNEGYTIDGGWLWDGFQNAGIVFK